MDRIIHLANVHSIVSNLPSSLYIRGTTESSFFSVYATMSSLRNPPFFNRAQQQYVKYAVPVIAAAGFIHYVKTGQQQQVQSLEDEPLSSSCSSSITTSLEEKAASIQSKFSNSSRRKYNIDPMDTNKYIPPPPSIVGRRRVSQDPLMVRTIDRSSLCQNQQDMAIMTGSSFWTATTIATTPTSNSNQTNDDENDDNDEDGGDDDDDEPPIGRERLRGSISNNNNNSNKHRNDPDRTNTNENRVKTMLMDLVTTKDHTDTNGNDSLVDDASTEVVVDAGVLTDYVARSIQGMVLPDGSTVGSENYSQDNDDDYNDDDLSTIKEVYEMMKQCAAMLQSELGGVVGQSGGKLSPWFISSLMYYIKERVDTYSKYPSKTKREIQQHSLYPRIDFQEINDLHDKLILAELGYSNSIEYIQDTLKTNYNVELVSCVLTSLPNQPRHFVAIRTDRTTARPTEIIIVIGGTNAITDVITDLLYKAVPYQGGLAHKGILESGQWIVNQNSDLLEKLRIQSGKEKIKLTLIGHSLGAGAATSKLLLTELFCLLIPRC
jgi:hypothetical protein